VGGDADESTGAVVGGIADESAGAVVGGNDPVASPGGAAEAGGAQSAIEISSRPPISTIEISSCCFSRPHASHAQRPTQRAIELRISGGSSGRTKRTSASSAAVVPSVTYLGRKNASQPGTTLGSRVIHSSASKLKSMSTRRSRKVIGPRARYSPACNAINGNQSGTLGRSSGRGRGIPLHATQSTAIREALSEGHQRDHASRKCPFLPRHPHATQSIAIRVQGTHASRKCPFLPRHKGWLRRAGRTARAAPTPSRARGSRVAAQSPASQATKAPQLGDRAL